MLNAFPLVSVIVPTHNRPEFLKKTIQHILQQTYTNLEVIVVSNGSNENNAQVVRTCNDQRLIYLEQENSGGPAAPRNNGIRNCQGYYVAFCDDDDLWEPEKIAKQVGILEENLDHGLCYTKMLRFDGIREWSNQHEEGRATLKSLLYINTVPISSVIIRKRLLDQFGDFSESKSIGTAEDYEFLLRHVTTTKFYFLDEYLVKYWSGGNRATSNTPSLKHLTKHCYYIFSCYLMLWTLGRVKLQQVVRPSIQVLIMLGKNVCYQLLFGVK